MRAAVQAVFVFMVRNDRELGTGEWESDPEVERPLVNASSTLGPRTELTNPFSLSLPS